MSDAASGDASDHQGEGPSRVKARGGSSHNKRRSKNSNSNTNSSSSSGDGCTGRSGSSGSGSSSSSSGSYSSSTTGSSGGSAVLGPIICPGHTRPVPDLHYSNMTADGFFLISSCLDGKPMIRQGVSGDWIGTFEGHKGAVWVTRINATAELALTGSGDFSGALWDAVTGDMKYSLPHSHIVRAAAFSKDSSCFYTGGMEKKLRIFDIEKPDSPTILKAEHKIHYLEASEDINVIFSSSSEDGSVSVWDKRSGQVSRKMKAGSMSVSSIQVCMDGGVLSVASDKRVHFFDCKSFKELKTHAMTMEVDCVSYHPRAKVFVTGSDSELNARVFSYETGKELAINKGHHGPVRCVAFSPLGDAYATGSEDGTIRIWPWSQRKAAKLAAEKDFASA